MSDIYSNKYHVSCLQYHIIFFTNNFLLNEEEVNFIRSYFKNVSNRYEFKILEMEMKGYRVKLLINCKTTHYIPNIMKALKGGSARFLFKEFPESKLKNGSSLWDQKYFISTDEKQLDNLIKKYKETL